MPSDSTQSGEQILSWGVAESPFTIECLPAVLAEIRTHAMEGLKRLSRGGVECGGVLYGERGEGLVRILTWRPIVCEHAHGAALVLSEQDRARLEQSLESAKSDPGLSDLHPLGWFVSHTKAGVALTDTDLKIYDHYFPWSWQIALVVKPASDGPTEAGFFFREQNGTVKADASYRPFLIEDGGAPAAPIRERVEPPIAARATRLAFRNRNYWIWALLLLAAGSVAAMLVYKPADSNTVPGLGLHLADTGGELHIEWDKNAKAIRDAARASLDVKDGASQVQIPIDARALHDGSVTYARKSGDVEIAMAAYPAKGDPVQEIARFVGSAEASGAPAGSDSAGERERLMRQVEQLRGELQKETGRRRELENTVKTLQSRPAPAPKAAAVPKGKRRKLLPWRRGNAR